MTPKDEQKRLLIEMMQEDEKNGMYEVTDLHQTISIPVRCIPEGSKLVEAYETLSKVVVMYGAGEEIPEDHNCDEMGCGSLSHVKYKLRKP